MPVQNSSDAILLNKSLTAKHKNLAKKVFDASMKKFKEEFKSSNIFRESERTEYMNKVDLAIKAILQHEINKKEGI